jgi:hypothetical protein
VRHENQYKADGKGDISRSTWYGKKNGRLADFEPDIGNKGEIRADYGQGSEKNRQSTGYMGILGREPVHAYSTVLQK